MGGMVEQEDRLLMWYPLHTVMVSGLKQTELPFFPL
jgi:hypothetical protein